MTVQVRVSPGGDGAAAIGGERREVVGDGDLADGVGPGIERDRGPGLSEPGERGWGGAATGHLHGEVTGFFVPAIVLTTCFTTMSVAVAGAGALKVLVMVQS